MKPVYEGVRPIYREIHVLREAVCQQQPERDGTG